MLSHLKTISIIIPTWNGKDLLEKHLLFVFAARTKDVVEIILVDDCSTDGTIEWAREKFPDLLTIRLVRRGYFSGAVNAGVGAATGDIVILLNNDVSPRKNFLEPLVKHFDDSAVFAVTCAEETIVNGKKVIRGRGEGAIDKGLLVHQSGSNNKPYSLWATGGSAAFDRRKWDELGGMDALFEPFYWEDIDLSYRAWKKGWSIIFEKNSLVEHIHEQTIGKYFSPAYIRRKGLRNQFLFAWKNFTDPSIMLMEPLWLIYHLLRTFIRLDFVAMFALFEALLKLPMCLLHRYPAQRTDQDVMRRHQLDRQTV